MSSGNNQQTKSELDKLNEMLEIMKEQNDKNDKVSGVTDVNSCELYNEISRNLKLKNNKGNTNDQIDLIEVVRSTIENVIKKANLGKNVNERCANEIKNKFETSFSQILATLNDCKGETSSEPLSKLEKLKHYLKCLKDSYAKLIDLKLDKNSISNCSNVEEEDFKNAIKNIKEEIKKHNYLLDTYYDKKKAQRLQEALKKVHERLNGNDKFCDFLLLAAATTYLKSTGKLSSKSEWFYEVVRAALTIKNFKFPYCPWLGDVAALVYAYLLVCDACSGTSGSSINLDRILEILKLLLEQQAQQKTQ